MAEPRYKERLKTKPLPPVFARIGAWMLRVSGWTRVGEVPKGRRFVAICAPHTSNWDLLYWLALTWSYGLRPRWMGKHTLFRWPLGVFCRWCGGVPIDRTVAHAAVDTMVEVFNQNNEVILGVAPEGTRKRAKAWKKGFYFIALEAKVPISLTFLDYGRRVCGVKKNFMPTGDIDEDMKDITEFYGTVSGRNPDRQGPAEFDSEERDPKG